MKQISNEKQAFEFCIERSCWEDKIMIAGDIYTSPIDFAVKRMLETLGDCENDKIIAESLKRSAKMWEAIRIHGLSICGLTYEEFCKQLEKKKNIIFLSDAELEFYNKAVKIMNVLQE